jgi:Na+/H+ antiporter NhaD/arsenite permease-like protein
MTHLKKRWLFLSTLALAAGLLFGFSVTSSQAEGGSSGAALTGSVFDRQGQAVQGATVSVQSPGGSGQESGEGEGSGAMQAVTQADGSYLLSIPKKLNGDQVLVVKRTHFQTTEVPLASETVEKLNAGEAVYLEDVVLVRQISLAFWVATIIFIIVLALIALGWLHNTLSALMGAALIFAVSYLGPLVRSDLFIFNFNGALKYIDWNVIFLIMGMMIVIAVVERTGIFQWLAFMAYKMSGGRVWLLLTILMIITGVASAFLDNVTTMLLMTPITVQIALSMGINPLALLMPEVFASNVVGISTLVGTPTNILIGSYAKISFTNFLSNLTPGVLLALLGLILYSLWVYRSEMKTNIDAEMAEFLMQKLEKQATISEPVNLKKAGWVALGMGILFVTGEHMHMLPSVTAIMGATALLVWIRPDIDEMIESVDWTTLVFFMTLFICVGAIQEVGLISFIADGIGKLVGENLILAMLAIIWIGALLSTVIANIPFTAAMLPVIGFLTGNIPGAESKALFYCLAVGSAMGGNGSLIGASANMVTAGIAERAGYSITYAYFLKKGFPALLITVGLATIWLLIRFL